MTLVDVYLQLSIILGVVFVVYIIMNRKELKQLFFSKKRQHG
jgi:hypothetical protein